MSRSVLNPNQLRMFMTPREIVGSIPQSETRMRTPEDAHTDSGAMYKVANAKSEPRFYQSVLKEGVKKPIDIVHDEDFGPQVVNGHHRLSVAAQVAPDRLIPVMHHPDMDKIDWGGAGTDPKGEKPYNYTYTY